MPNAAPENSSGPFYVEEGCCISCGVPVDLAPEIFDWSKHESHCFVSRQPETSDELDRTLRAMWSGEVDCIRYRGDEPAILARVTDFGLGPNCDRHPSNGFARPRTRVVFESGRPKDTAAALAERMRIFLNRPRDKLLQFKVRPARWSSRHTVRFSWDAALARELHTHAHFHDVRFGEGPFPGHFHAEMLAGIASAAIGLSLSVYDWLKDEEGARDMRWFRADQDWKAGDGLHMPI